MKRGIRIGNVLSFFALTVVATVLGSRAEAATIAVTSDSDDGSAGTLRSAITQANSSPGADTIIFGSRTVTLTSALPTITGELNIVGDSEAASFVQGGTTANQSSVSWRVFRVAAGADVEIRNMTVRHGRKLATTSTDFGGGILNDGTLLLESVSVLSNSSRGNGSSTGSGGGISNTGTLTLRDCRVAQNTTTAGSSGSPRGGGIFNTGQLVIEGSTIASNLATYNVDDGSGSGGGIFCSVGSVEIRDSTISSNGSRGYSAMNSAGTGTGGGISISGTGTLLAERVAIINNFAAGGYAFAGFNTGDGTGGGAYLANTAPGSCVLRLCTVSGNEVGPEQGYGGGIYARTGTVLDSCTIAGVPAGKYGDAMYTTTFVAGVGPIARNTIFASDKSRLPLTPNVRGSLNSRGWLLFETVGSQLVLDTTSAGNTDFGNLMGVPSQMFALADNGGPTLSHELSLISLARDAGTDVDIDGVPFATDQRGADRVRGARADIGAIEAGPGPSAVAGFEMYR